MKSLKQIWTDNNEKPFWAKWGDDIFYCTGVSPRGIALGWDENGDIEKWSSDNERCVQIDDPNKPKPKMRVWRHKNESILYFNEYPHDEGKDSEFEDITDLL